MEQLICIHGHFYQPPRENPWLEAVELQDSASPYHDWNERITYETRAGKRRTGRSLPDKPPKRPVRLHFTNSTPSQKDKFRRNFNSVSKRNDYSAFVSGRRKP